MVILHVLSNPILTLQPAILGILLGLMGRIAKECAREVYKPKLYTDVCLCGQRRQGNPSRVMGETGREKLQGQLILWHIITSVDGWRGCPYHAIHFQSLQTHKLRLFI